MRYKVKKEEILKKIEENEQQIEMFRKRMKTSDLCAELYDKAILDKAILKKELEECEKNQIMKMVKKFIPKHKMKKVLICDYFKD